MTITQKINEYLQHNQDRSMLIIIQNLSLIAFSHVEVIQYLYEANYGRSLSSDVEKVENPMYKYVLSNLLMDQPMFLAKEIYLSIQNGDAQKVVLNILLQSEEVISKAIGYFKQ